MHTVGIAAAIYLPDFTVLVQEDDEVEDKKMKDKVEDWQKRTPT